MTPSLEGVAYDIGRGRYTLPDGTSLTSTNIRLIVKGETSQA